MYLSEFLDRLDEVDEERDGWVAVCPAHADTVASLRVAVGKNGDRVIVRCRAGCDTPDVMQALGLTMADLATMGVDGAARSVKRATSTDERPSTAAIAALAADLDRFVADTGNGPSSAAREYARQRFGVGEDEFERFRLGYHDGRLIVPFLDADGVALGYQGRALDPNESIRWKGPRSPEGGGSWAKHGIFRGAGSWGEVIVAEGPGDGLTAATIGYDTVFVAGAANGRSARVLDAIADFADGRKIVVAGDGDRAGADFANAVTRGLIERDCTVAVLDVPAGRDLTDWREADPSCREIVRAVVDAPLQSTFSSASRARDEGVYPLTDLGNARYLRDYAKSQGSAIRYSPEAGFYVLSDGVWTPDHLDTARAYAQEAAEMLADISSAMVADAVSKEDTAAARRWAKWANYSQSTRGIDAAIREVKALRDVATSLDAFDKRVDLLPARNGVINLRTGELLPHDPAYLFTRRVDVNYDPNAQAPRWLRFLDEVFPGYPDLPRYMQRLTGYGITGRTDEQCFIIHWGGGSNGKSVFSDTLSEVFEQITVTTPFETFEAKPSGGIPNDIAALKGARLVVAAEGEAGKPMAEAVLKRLTGRDLVTARFMRKEFFTFRPTFLLMMSTNNKPAFRGQDDGLWRRVKLIPWERKFTPAERDPALGSTLLREAEGILAWAVAGAVEWYARGLQDPPVVIEATKEYRETSNALDGFLPGVFVRDESGEVLGAELYEEYREWADAEGLQPREIWQRRTLYASLEERGITKHKSRKGIVLVGIRRATAEESGSAPVRADSSGLADSPNTSVSGARLGSL